MNSNEKKLLTYFGIALFIVLNVVGYFWYNQLMRTLNTKKINLTTSRVEMDIWKKQAPAAETKRQWIEDHVATYADDITRESYLLGFLEGEATKDLNINITKNKPGETKMDAYFTRSIYEATVRGSWTDIMTFVYRLQAPKNLHFVKDLKLTPKKNESNDKEMDVECTFVIEKWWEPKTEDPTTAEEPAVQIATTELSAPAMVKTPATTETAATTVTP